MTASRSKRTFRLALWILAIVVIVGGLAWYVPQLLRPNVTVTTATRGPVVHAFYATGIVSPQREFPIRTATAGILTEMLVDRGTPVTRGQTIAVVDAPDLRYALARAQAELTEKQQRAHPETSPVLRELDARLIAAEALLDVAKREQTRLENLVATGGATTVDVDRALDRVKSLTGERESLVATRAMRKLELDREAAVAEAAVQTAAWNLEQATIKSPIDGVVLDRPRSQGTRVAVNDELMRIADVRPEKLVMRAAVDEEDIAEVQRGQTVRMTLYAFPGRTFTGRVALIYDEADANRRTFEVDIEVDEPDARFAAGMTGELAFILAEKSDARVLPAQAAQADGLYVVRAGIARRIPATFGLRGVERVELLSDLDPNDQVIISAVTPDIDGQRVRTTFLDPTEAAGLNTPETQAGSSGAMSGFR